MSNVQVIPNMSTVQLGKAAPLPSHHFATAIAENKKEIPHGTLATSSSSTISHSLPGLVTVPSKSSNCTKVLPSPIPAQSSSHSTKPRSSAVDAPSAKTPSIDPDEIDLYSVGKDGEYTPEKFDGPPRSNRELSRDQKESREKGAEDVYELSSDEDDDVPFDGSAPKPTVNPAPRPASKSTDQFSLSDNEDYVPEPYRPDYFHGKKKMPDGTERKTRNPKAPSKRVVKGASEPVPKSTAAPSPRSPKRSHQELVDGDFATEIGTEHKVDESDRPSKRAVTYGRQPVTRTTPEPAVKPTSQSDVQPSDTPTPQSAPESGIGSPRSPKRSHQTLVDDDFSTELDGTTGQIANPVKQSNKMPRLSSTPLPRVREE